MLISRDKVVESYGSFEDHLSFNGRIAISSSLNSSSNLRLFVKYIRLGNIQEVVNTLSNDIQGFYAFYFDSHTRRLYILTSLLLNPQLTAELGMSKLVLDEDQLFLIDRPIKCSSLLLLQSCYTHFGEVVRIK